MIGHVFNRLTVLGYSHARGLHKYWKCKCECGNVSSVRTQNLRSGKTRSCGCLQKENSSKHFKDNVAKYNKNRRLPNRLGVIGRIYSRYKSNSKSRNIDFNLTIDTFRVLISGNCHYCGIPPISIQKARNPEAGIVTYNGIDRVDNTQGYVESNVVSCCYQCNLAKRDQTAERFLEWARRIVYHIDN